MKKVLFFLFAALVLIVPSYKVYAVDISELICDDDNVYDIKKKASNIKTTYEYKEDNYNGKHFKIKVSNLDPALEIRIYGRRYNYEQDGSSFYLLQPFGIEGEDVQLLIYGAETHACKDQYVTTVHVKLPKYNTYSELDECVEYEEFPLCNRFYSGKIESIQEFRLKLKEYIEKVNKKPDNVKDLNIFEKILIFIEDHQLLSAIVGILLIILIIVIIVRKIIRRIKRQKIRF